MPTPTYIQHNVAAWASLEKAGVGSLDRIWRGGASKLPTLNIPKTGRSIFAKFSRIGDLPGSNLHFGTEFGGFSYLESSEDQNRQCGSRMDRFVQAPEILRKRYL